MTESKLPDDIRDAMENLDKAAELRKDLLSEKEKERILATLAKANKQFFKKLDEEEKKHKTVEKEDSDSSDSSDLDDLEVSDSSLIDSNTLLKIAEETTVSSREVKRPSNGYFDDQPSTFTIQPFTLKMQLEFDSRLRILAQNPMENFILDDENKALGFTLKGYYKVIMTFLSIILGKSAKDLEEIPFSDLVTLAVLSFYLESDFEEYKLEDGSVIESDSIVISSLTPEVIHEKFSTNKISVFLMDDGTIELDDGKFKIGIRLNIKAVNKRLLAFPISFLETFDIVTKDKIIRKYKEKAKIFSSKKLKNFGNVIYNIIDGINNVFGLEEITVSKPDGEKRTIQPIDLLFYFFRDKFSRERHT